MAKSSKKTDVKDDDKYNKPPKQDEKWSFTSLLIDVIAGYLSWSITVQIAIDVFFYPLFAMEFTGYEIFLASLISGSLLGFNAIKSFAVKRFWLFKLLSLIAFTSYYQEVVRDKLPLLGAGLAIDLIGSYGILVCSNKERRDRSFFGYFLGLILLVCVRVGFRSLDPVWSTREGNILALVGGVICATYYLVEGASVDTKPVKDEERPSWIVSGLAVGSALFFTHVFFTESGVISRWVEYPPFPHGILIILAMGLGLMLSFQPVVGSFLYWLGMGLGSWILFISAAGSLFPPYVEFFGGILFTVYTMSVWYTALDQLSKTKNIGRAFFIGGLWYTIAQLWAVYTVAYKFVPGGFVLRERSKSMVFIPLVFLALAHVKTFLPVHRPNLQRIRSQVGAMLFVIFLLALAPSAVFRARLAAVPPVDPNPPQLKPLAWAIHFGYDNIGGLNYEGMADVIRKSGANIIGMVETDAARHFMGNRDGIQWLADELHFYADYGPSTAQNSWGCALLTVWPIVRSERVIMPSPEGELACLINADIRMPNGTTVNVVVAHFGNTEDQLDLQLQTEYLANVIAPKKNQFSPTIFIGYLTTDPYAERYLKLIQAGWRDSFTSLDRYCLYILYKDLKSVGFERYDKGNVSDTEAQVGAFVLTTPQTPINPTPANCRAFGNDSVGCQYSEKCGWCQLMTSGHCYEPTQRGACLSFGGVWAGPTDGYSGTATEEEKKEFIRAQHEIQSKGLYPLVAKGKTFTWTIADFANLDSWTSRWGSSIFEYNGAYWRLWIFMRNKRGAPTERYIQASVEVVYAVRNPSQSVTLSLASTDGDATVPQTIAIRGTQQVTLNFLNFVDLHKLIKDSNTFRLLATFD